MSKLSSSGNPSTENVERNALLLDRSALTTLLASISSLGVTIDGMKALLEIQCARSGPTRAESSRSDEAYKQKPLWDESTCRTLYEIAVAKTKEKVERWNGTVDVTLIFITLFSAVLTSFLVPACQALSPSTETQQNFIPIRLVGPSAPETSAEPVCALYYSSLITSMLVAVLCVLTRQWARKWTKMPEVDSWKARTIWHVERMKLAEPWIKCSMEILYYSLLLSIGLFVAGLLYQLRNLSTSFEGGGYILMATWTFGLMVVTSVVFTLVISTFHAIRYEGSIFKGSLSDLVVRSAVHRPVGTSETVNISSSINRSPVTWGEPFHLIVLRLKRVALDWFTGPRIPVECDSMDKLMNAYLELIAEVNDPNLLEGVVASFSYSDWVQYGDGCVEQLTKVVNRFMASDTSRRVRQTVMSQISRLSSWLHERQSKVNELRTQRTEHQNWMAWIGGGFHSELMRMKQEEEEEAERERRILDVTTFLLQGHGHPIYRNFLPTYQNCAYILEIVSLPLEESIARCLRAYDDQRPLGDCDKIFSEAVDYCDSLLRSGRKDALTRILAGIDRLSVVKSFMRWQGGDHYPFNDFFIEFVEDIGDCRDSIFQQVNQLLKEPGNWAGLDLRSTTTVFVALAGSSPLFDPAVDLSLIIDHISRYPSLVHWQNASDVVIAYLEQCGISAISDQTSLHQFLRLCLDLVNTSEKSRERAQNILHRYESLFQLGSLSGDEGHAEFEGIIDLLHRNKEPLTGVKLSSAGTANVLGLLPATTSLTTRQTISPSPALSTLNTSIHIGMD